jgi:hypothetical protein
MVMGKLLRFFALVSVLTYAGFVMAGESPEPDHHEHKAPHGGALVVFGEEFAHLELVLDSQEGLLTAYVLDGEAEHAVRIAQPEIQLKLTAKSQDAWPLSLNAQANVLTGEKVTDSSEFTGQSDKLKGVEHFDGEVVSLAIKGQTFHNIKFRFPEGNEE